MGRRPGPLRVTCGAPVLPDGCSERLVQPGLETNGYHLLAARFEPENHVDLIIEGCVRSGSRVPLVAVGSGPNNNGYMHKVHAAAQGKVRFLGEVQDQELLDRLHGNARVYWHGHPVGRAHPSLLRAMGAGAAVNAFDVGFNRGVLRRSGHYFSDSRDVAALVRLADAKPEAPRDRGRRAPDALAAGYGQPCRSTERPCATSAGWDFSSRAQTGARPRPGESRTRKMPCPVAECFPVPALRSLSALV